MSNLDKLATYKVHKRKKQNEKHNTICAGHHYTQANTNNVTEAWALLQTAGGKDEPDIVFVRKS